MFCRLGRVTHLAAMMACALLVGCRGMEKPRWLATPPSTVSREAAEDGSTIAGSASLAGKSRGDKAAPKSDQVAEDKADPGADKIARVSLEETASEGDKEAVKDAALAWAEPIPVPPLADGRNGAAAAPPGEILSVQELQLIATAGNPTLRQAGALVEQAQGNWLQSGLYPNIELGYNGQGNNGAFDQQGFYAQQTFVTGNKLGLNRQVATFDVQRARLEADAQALRVVNEIRIRYIAALGAQRQVVVADELVKVADKGVKISEQMLEAESVPKVDVLQAKLQRNQTLIVLRNARFKSAATWQQLGNVVGDPGLPPRLLEGSLEDGIADIDWEFAWQRLMRENPLVQAARARVSAAAAQVQREQAQVIPDVNVAFNRWQDMLGRNNVMYGAQVGMKLPTWDRNQGNIAAAVGNLKAAQAEAERLQLNLRDLLAASYQRYRTARNQVDVYRDTILPIATENLSLTTKAYEEGELDFLRVLTARRDLFQANIDYVNALTDLRIAIIEIEGMQLIGGLDQVVSNPIESNQAGQTNGPGAQ